MDTFFGSWLVATVAHQRCVGQHRRAKFSQIFLGSLLLGPLITLMLAITREAGNGIRQVDPWRGRARPIPPTQWPQE